MKYLIPLILVFIVGCSDKNNTIKDNKTIKNNYDVKYIKYDNTNHIVGNKLNSIITLQYLKTKNNIIDRKITFYIDKLPYTKDFNLCIDRIDIKCKGKILFNKFNGKYNGNISLNLIDGYYIFKSKDIEYVPSSINHIITLKGMISYRSNNNIETIEKFNIIE